MDNQEVTEQQEPVRTYADLLGGAHLTYNGSIQRMVRDGENGNINALEAVIERYLQTENMMLWLLPVLVEFTKTFDQTMKVIGGFVNESSKEHVKHTEDDNTIIEALNDLKDKFNELVIGLSGNNRL